MSGRALLAIGCNLYDNLKPLKGAEADAQGLYNLLIQPEIGDYDVGRSRLLTSPTLQTVREALADIVFGGEPLDTLTVTFAGHGTVSGGSFYMDLRDSRLEALSATALPLADLFRMIAEAAPRQTYIVLDACQSGGLISDLNVILKSEVMGEFGTPGVSLLATSASNESALESGGQGVGTRALLECIRGDILLQDTNAALDLIEIGRAVSERVSAAGVQTPVVWGLNLYGPAGFCKNPHAGTGDAPLRSVQSGWPDASTSAAIRSGLPKLWSAYVAIATKWDARGFTDRLTGLLRELEGDPGVQVNLVERIGDACAVQAKGARDHFREIEVRAACAIALLPFSADPAIAAHLAKTCSKIATLVEEAIGAAVAAIEAYEFALVTGGLDDLYYLPIRLSQLLGWAGFAVHTRLWTAEESNVAATRLEGLMTQIFETYSLSLVAMSDAQSPYMLSALTAASRVGLNEQGEQVLGHLFSSAVNCGGRVARPDLDPSKVLGFLVARADAPASPNAGTVAQPTELMLTLLRTAPLFNLADEFDTALEQVDHLIVNAFLPDRFADFGAELIADGTNALFQIGHDIWSIAEIEAAWPENPAPGDPGTAMAALAASLLFPDRTPWFLLATHQLVEGQVADPV